jgi:hypothetical protein
MRTWERLWVLDFAGTGIPPTKDTIFSASSGGGTGGVNGGSTPGAGRSGAQSASQSRSSPSAREHPVPPQEPRHVGALAGTCPQGLARQRGEDLRLDTAPVLRPEGAVDSLVEQASWVDPPRLEHSARRARRPERSDGENTGSYPQGHSTVVDRVAAVRDSRACARRVERSAGRRCCSVDVPDVGPIRSFRGVRLQPRRRHVPRREGRRSDSDAAPTERRPRKRSFEPPPAGGAVTP